VLLLESLSHSREIKSSLKNKNQDLDLRERGERAQALDLKKAFWFSQWPTTIGSRWGSIYNPHLKKSRWEAFHWSSPVRPPNKSGGPLWKPV
jgi:hypothetical protein